MNATQIEQDAYAVTIDPETVEYRLETTVLTAGELPSTAIFVYTISKEDLSKDLFSRVANVSDLENLSVDRAAAVAAKGTEYLRSYNQIQYADLEIAKQAKGMLTSRINSLINTWVTFRDDFQKYNNQHQYFPTVDPDYETQLKKNYATAKAERIRLESQVTTQEAVVAAAKAESDTAQQIVQIYQVEYDFCGKALDTDFNYYVNLVTTEGTAAGAYRIGPLNSEFQAFAAAANANLVSWKNTKIARDQTVSTESTKLYQYEAQLAEAQNAEDAALAAIKQVCPNFNPSSV